MAQKERTAFLLPVNKKEIVDDLNNEEAGMIFKAIYNYVVNKEIFKSKDRFLNLAFKQFKEQLDISEKLYQEKCEKNRENAYKRWNKENDKSIENKGEIDNNKNTNVYERIKDDAIAYANAQICMPKMPIKNIKVKSKNIKYKIKNKKYKIYSSNCVYSSIKDRTRETNYTQFTLENIFSIGEELGIEKNYCKKFFDYYESIDWITSKGERIKNVKPLLKKWYSQDEEKIKNQNRRRSSSKSKEDIENETKRIFGSV